MIEFGTAHMHWDRGELVLSHNHAHIRKKMVDYRLWPYGDINPKAMRKLLKQLGYSVGPWKKHAHSYFTAKIFRQR